MKGRKRSSRRRRRRRREDEAEEEAFIFSHSFLDNVVYPVLSFLSFFLSHLPQSHLPSQLNSISLLPIFFRFQRPEKSYSNSKIRLWSCDLLDKYFFNIPSLDIIISRPIFTYNTSHFFFRALLRARRWLDDVKLRSLWFTLDRRSIRDSWVFSSNSTGWFKSSKQAVLPGTNPFILPGLPGRRQQERE